VKESDEEDSWYNDTEKEDEDEDEDNENDEESSY
jgi:hypothetical protein